MKKIFSVIALIAVFALAAFADVRLPDTPTPKPKPTDKPKLAKSIDTQMYISLRQDAKETRLIIPKSQLQQLRAALDEMEGDDDGAAKNATAAVVSFSKTQTVIGGLCLSLAFVFGGVWLTRSRAASTGVALAKKNKTFAIIAVFFLCGALATITFANIGPPLEARSITGKTFSSAVHQYKQASGRIKLEVSNDDARGIELIVPDTQKENTTSREE